MAKKILFILPHSIRKGPSQRYRVGLFLPELDSRGIQYKLAEFFDEASTKILYEPGHMLQKIWIMIKGYLKRFYTVLFQAWRYDYVFVQRGASPVGPPIFEWLLAKVLRKKIIYDFDDAIWMQNNDAMKMANVSRQSVIAGWFKAFWKVKYICKWSYKVVGGNDFLCDYARQYNKNTLRIPTCVDTGRYHNKQKVHHDGDLVIGWTGSHTTLLYLDEIKDVLIELQKELDFSFLVICNKPPEWTMDKLLFVKWSSETEVEDLLKMDIGIMPLKETKWTLGKCGFKLIQYMSLGIPSVASPAGVNREIIDHEKNGFICNSPEEWKSAFRKLLADRDLRQQMGEAGRKKIVDHYSIRSQAEAFAGLFS